MKWTDHADGGAVARAEQWQYNYSSIWESGSCQGYCTSIVAPDGSKTTTFFNNSLGVRGTVAKEVLPDGSTREYAYEQNPAYLQHANSEVLVNPFLALSVHTVAQNGSPSLAAIESRNIDQNGNLTLDSFYDWIPYSQLQHDSSGNLSGFSGGTILRNTTDTYTVSIPNATNGNGPPDYPSGYWNPNAAVLRGLLATSATSGAGAGAKAQFSYDAAGNLKVESHWDSVAGKYWATQRSYDGFGNLLQTVDPKNHVTQWTYDSNSLYAVQNTVAAGTPQSETSRYTWDNTFGLIASKTDPNNVTTSYSYDPQGRQISVTAGSGTPVATVTLTTYDDANRRIIVEHDKDATDDYALVSVTNYDELGRVTLTQQLENKSTQSPTDITAGIKVQTRYFYGQGGLYRISSNPYRAANSGAASTEPTMGWTVTRYDSNNRPISTQSFNGSGVPAPWGSNTTQTGVTTTSYNAQKATVTEQAANGSNVTVNTVDGLGRLISVQEPQLNILDAYSYDALGNLLVVNQNGRTRNFSYDSLSRLLAAKNPESGVVAYSYDPNGNVTQKVDARSAMITYSYDPLDRLTSKMYSGFGPQVASTPNVSYTYDAGGAAAHAIGKLTQVYNQNATNSYTSFDPFGRVLASSQKTGSYTYTFAYTYNLAGSMTSEKYPHGGVLTTAYDGANRPYSATGALPPHINPYIHQATYWPNGALQSYQRNNNLWHVAGYNSRLQRSESYEAWNNNPSTAPLVSCLNWGEQPNYNGGIHQFCPVSNAGADNGNLLGASYTYSGPDYAKPVTVNQSYTADAGNRLTNVVEAGNWARGFDYDYYGNRWVDPGSSRTYGIAPSGTTPTANVFNASNQINGSVTYDAAGNQTVVSGNISVGDSALYDAENQLVQTAESPSLGGAVEPYFYDGEGRRVEKIEPGNVIVVYVYDATGLLAAEYTNLPSYSSPCVTPCYLTHDHLGSLRMVTDQASNLIARHDYLPFGEEVPGGSFGRSSKFGPNDGGYLPLKFTGQLRDGETGLDYFGARYYGSALGRFTSPDDPLVDQHASDPQSWNLYAYVRNNPLKNTDPNGLDCVNTSTQTSSGVEVTTERGGSADTCSGTYVNGTVDVSSYSYNGRNLGYSFSNDTASGAGTITFGAVDDWGPGTSNLLGARQIGMTAPIGSALGIGMGAILTGGAAIAAYGALAGGSSLTALAIPAATLPPAVSNPTLQGIVQKLFQATDVLPGGTAGAVRYELATGDLMSPAGHSLKAQEVVTALTNLLKSGRLSFDDQIVSRQLIQNLSDALKTLPRR